MHGGDALPLAKEDDLMSHVLVVMTQKSFGCAGIVDKKGALAGIITDGDLRRHMGGGLLQEKAGKLMTRNPTVVAPGILAAEALQILNEKSVRNYSWLRTASRSASCIFTIFCARAWRKF